MKLNLSIDLKRLIHEMRGPKGVSALTEEFMRVSGELKKLRDQVTPEARARIKDAEKQGHAILMNLKAAQKELESEVKSRITKVKKQAQTAETQIEKYKNLAAAQKERIEKEWKVQIQTQLGKGKKTAKKSSIKTAGPQKKSAGTKKAAGKKKAASATAKKTTQKTV